MGENKTKCKICKSEANLFQKANILNKYEVSYFRCMNCGFIQTEEPYWLDEAYSSAITKSDIGIINRNFEYGRKLIPILNTFFPQMNNGLDYGGGYGIFVRLMRDAGFDFEWYDKYCENVFAKGHEKSREHYDIVTAFELFEHLQEPYDDISILMETGDNIIISTVLLPEPNPSINEWWYYSPETGQHVSFYTVKAMEIIAEKYKRYYTSCGTIHIFSKNPISHNRLNILNHLSNKIIIPSKRESLLDSDYKSITGRNLK